MQAHGTIARLLKLHACMCEVAHAVSGVRRVSCHMWRSSDLLLSTCALLGVLVYPRFRHPCNEFPNCIQATARLSLTASHCWVQSIAAHQELQEKHSQTQLKHTTASEKASECDQKLTKANER